MSIITFNKRYNTKLYANVNRAKRAAGITQEILKDVNIFKGDLDTKKQEVSKLISNVNEAKKTINDAKAKAEAALKTLNGKI